MFGKKHTFKCRMATKNPKTLQRFSNFKFANILITLNNDSVLKLFNFDTITVRYLEMSISKKKSFLIKTHRF